MAERIPIASDHAGFALKQRLVEALRDLGYVVIHASGPTQALAMLEDHPSIDLLFTDIVMPDMTGATLAGRVRERMPGLPVSQALLLLRLPSLQLLWFLLLLLLLQFLLLLQSLLLQPVFVPSRYPSLQQSRSLQSSVCSWHFLFQVRYASVFGLAQLCVAA